MDSTLVELFKHNRWANLQLLASCDGLDDEQLTISATGTYGRLGDTLVHILAAEERYVELLSGQRPHPPLSERNDFPGFETLRTRAERSGQALIEIASRDPFDEVLRGTWRDEPYAMRALLPLVQVINHATEHRSQVMTILTQHGFQPPDLSGWAYGAEMGYDDVAD
jgi:uncharacterized damage-inducible protein DinB